MRLEAFVGVVLTSMKGLRLMDLPMLAAGTRACNHPGFIAFRLRPLTPAIREVATAAAAAAWLNSTFCALHTTALALQEPTQGSAVTPRPEEHWGKDCQGLL
jgi:hypothetical protein